jgi:TonB family protein
MRLDTRRILPALCAALVCGNAAGEWRCDCTRIVGSCSASATAGASFIEVKSNVEQCARVDYFVDGIPFVALVVDGTERQDWIAESTSPSIIVSSCEICLDNSTAQVARPVGSSIVSEGEPVRLIGVTPVYPPAAAAAGIEGYVDLRFTLSPSGTVVNPEVVGAEPPGVFDDAALAAVSRWRYTHPAGATAPVVNERVEFNLTEEIFSLTASEPRSTAPSEQDAPGRNRCIREDSRYDFGASIDVSLVNACAEPLMVYNCSAGTGPNRELWVCGETGASLPAASRLEITRAPNGEYWWLACAVDDAACRDQGSEWVRAMDRQHANVDPQDRTRLRLARSY